MTQNARLNQAYVWRIAQQITAAGPGGTTLQALPGSPFRPGRLRRFGSAVVSLPGAGVTVSLLSALMTLVLWLLSEHGGTVLSSWWSPLQRSSQQDLLLLFPALSLFIFAAAYGSLRRFSDLRYLTWTAAGVFATTIVFPLMVLYIRLDTNWAIYFLIVLFGPIFYVGGALVIDKVPRGANQGGKIWGRGTGVNGLVFLVIAVCAVAWGLLLAEGAIHRLGLAESDAAVQNNAAAEPMPLPEIEDRTAAGAAENQNDDGKDGVFPLVRDGIVLAVFVLWTALIMAFQYLWYIRVKSTLTQHSEAATSSTQLVEDAVRIIRLQFSFQGDEKRRKKLQQKCGKRLGSKTLNSRIGFLASYTVGAAAGSQNDIGQRKSRVDDLTKGAFVRGIHCGVEQLVRRQSEGSSAWSITAMVGDLDLARKPMMFNQVVFALAESLSHWSGSTSNTETGSLPLHSAAAAHMLADEIVEAICGSRIDVLISRAFVGADAGAGEPDSPADPPQPRSVGSGHTSAVGGGILIDFV